MHRFFILAPLIAALAALPAAGGNEARLLRFPAMHGDRIVFTYAGDLHTVPADPGTVA